MTDAALRESIDSSEVTEGRDLYHLASSAFGDSTNRAEPRGLKVSRYHRHLKGSEPLAMGHEGYKKK